MPSKHLLVFPTSRAIRAYVNNFNENRLLPTLLSIDELFFKSITVGNRQFIDEEHQFLFLKESTNIKNFSKLGISNNFNDFIKQSNYIFRFFSELSAEKVSIETIQSADTYEFYEEHLSILKKIKENYIQLLEENGYVDKITLGNVYAINKAYIKQYTTIEIFFEGYFTNFEFDLIEAISKLTEVIIHLDTNEYNKKSYEKFVKSGFLLEENKRYKINISTKEIVSVNALQNKIQTIELKAFSTRVNQIAFVKKAITDMIHRGIKAEKIVLIVPDEQFTQTLQLFDDEAYFNYAMGREIKTSKLFSTVDAIYHYFNENEQKNIDYVNFLNLDNEYLNTKIKSSWNRQITIELFEEIVEFVKKDEPNEDILEKFEEEVFKLKNLIFNYNQTISLKEAYKFMLQRVSQITTDDINGGVITVMGLLETRGAFFDGVIIVDFNEGIVPKRSIKDKFLSTAVKKHAQLPTLKDRENLQKYYYNKLCKNAKEVFISYVRNETSQISRFANELFPTYKIENKTYDEVYKNILYTKNRLSHFNDDIVFDINLASVEWSATSLKILCECKRKFYLKYIAKIHEHHFSLKPEGFELGRFIHKVLEDFFNKNRRVEATTTHDILNEYFQNIQNLNPFLILDLEIWKQKLQNFIQNEKKEFEKEKEVFQTEMPFKIVHNNIVLKGVIDRIDVSNDAYEIIDYKTSSSLKVDTIKTYEKSTDFQLEFYFLAMKNQLEENRNLKQRNIKPYYYDLNSATMIEEQVLNEKLIRLDSVLQELNTKSVNFKKCEDKLTCQYCPYTTLCAR